MESRHNSGAMEECLPREDVSCGVQNGLIPGVGTQGGVSEDGGGG